MVSMLGDLCNEVSTRQAFPVEMVEEDIEEGQANGDEPLGSVEDEEDIGDDTQELMIEKRFRKKCHCLEGQRVKPLERRSG